MVALIDILPIADRAHFMPVMPRNRLKSAAEAKADVGWVWKAVVVPGVFFGRSVIANPVHLVSAETASSMFGADQSQENISLLQGIASPATVSSGKITTNPMDKQYILNEIRRTAEANGGTPHGRKRFFDETGIKESDWTGKIWARWSDAVEEAGYEPLKLQGKHDRAARIQKIAEMTRAIGRFPTVAEMRLEKRRDPLFPNEKGMRLAGGRGGLIAEVLAYCRLVPDLSDVVGILEKIEPVSRLEKASKLENNATLNHGYVYLLRAGKRYKIGHAIAPLSRAMVISNMTPEGADRLHEIRTDDPRGIEEYWHRRFADKRGNGEWFALTSADVSAFKRRKFM